MSLSSPATQSRKSLSGLYGAMAWMVLALVCFSIAAIAGREAGRVLSTNELIFWRSAVGIALVLTLLRWQGLPVSTLKTHVLPLHTARAGVHFGAQFAWLYALTLIPLGELFALEFTSPLWVALLAPLFLGERLTAWRMAAALIGFFGALMVVQPDLLGGHISMSLTRGSLYAILAALGFAASMIFVKRLTRSEPAVRVLFWMQVVQGVIAIVLLAGVAIATGHLPLSLSTAFPLRPVGYAVLFGVAAFGAHFGQARAFALADAIIVAPMDFLRLPLIVLVGALLYGEKLGFGAGLGAAVLVFANGLNMWAERRGMRRGA